MGKSNDKEVTSDLFFKLEILTAGWFELLLVRIFGKKFVSQDSGLEVTLHYWRGKQYMTGLKTLEPHNTELNDNGR